MTRLMLFAMFLSAFAVLATAASAMAGDQPAAPASSPAGQCKILVLTGNEHPSHNWKETAPLLAKILAADPRLSATVNSDPGFLASPRLHDYDVLMLNYMNWESPGPGKDAQQNLKKFVEEGKGLVLVHFACGAFQDWPEFKNIAGRVWDPKLRPHDAYGRFRVEIADPEHPIVKGMKPFETVDELYTCLAGDKEIQVLAKATSKADKKDYPMAFVNRYGKGHVFHCVLGHDVQALAADGVRELYRRGTAWAGGLPPATPSLYAFCVEEGVPGVKPRPIAEQAKLFRELEFDGAAYPLWLDGQLSGNLQILDQAGLQFFMAFIRVNLKNVAQPFDPRVAAAMSQLKGRNTTVCVLLGGLKPGDPQGMEPAVKILRELGDQAARYDLRISIYHHMGDWTEGLPFALEVAKNTAHPNVGVNFNLCHWLKVEGDKDYRPLLRENAARIFAVTINGAKLGTDTWTDGLIQPLDLGDFDNRSLLATLREAGYRGPIGLMCFRVPGDPRDYLARSMKTWRQLSQSLRGAR